MDEKTVKENMLCFNFSCPDFISRYRLSKQAEKKVVRMKHLAEDGSKIGTVSHPGENPLGLALPSSRDYEDFHSRQKDYECIVDALKDSNVNMIGVYGAGGVGKTTMVGKVCKLLKEDGTFDEVVVAVVSKNANVINIQRQLADRLNLTLRGETEVGRANQLWNRLDDGKKNLIILDDVWQELDLTKIGIPIKAGNKRCKVVLTSRNRDVWKNMDVDVYFHVGVLTEDDAWTLLKKKVGNHVDSHDEPRHYIARAICKECQGLPVAINAIGAALKGKGMYAWQDALDKLKNSMLKDIEGIDQKVYASLRWSYDHLESEDAKSCFLLCCLFAEDAEISINDLVRYYMAWRTSNRYQMPVTLEQAFDRVCTVVDALKSCCLLLDGESKHLVKMHDVVRDIAISIAKDEKSFLVKHGFKYWPEKAAYEHCSVISLRPDDVHKFPDKLVCSELHTLRLDCAMNGSLLQVPDEFFIGTGNLMVLDLKEVIMSPLLPASLAKLAKLQMLSLNKCHLGDITILKGLKDHLEILSLQGSRIEVLPPEVGELKRLRLLDMSDCDKLRMISKGVISKLFRLEELYMPMSFRKWEGIIDERETSSVSLDELMLLTQLTTLHIWIPDATLLPMDLTFANLVRFRIQVGGERFDDADQYFRQENSCYTQASTRVFRLENFHIANTLEFLRKPKCSISRNDLYLSLFINHLTDLSVTDCGLKYLFSPSCARGLVRLQCLTIKHCRAMEGVVGIEEDKDEDILIIFSGLKLLYLKNLPNLINFFPKKKRTITSGGSSSSHAQTVLFNDKVIFPFLEVFEVDGLDNIVEIWDKQSLEVFEVDELDIVEILDKQSTSSENSLSCCKLRSMKVQHCKKLTNLVPSNILPRLQNLEKLCVGGCPNIKFVVFGNGKEQEASDDNTLVIPQLRHLTISDMENLESFYSSSTASISNAQSLFNYQVIFPVLEVFEVDRLDKIVEIWDKQSPLSENTVSFCKLWNMKVQHCKKLMNLVPTNILPRLQNLQKLCVEGCPNIKFAVFKNGKEQETADDNTLVIPQLRYLTISDMENLESFYTSSTASNAQSLFNYQVKFPKLENLELEGLQNMDNIWGTEYPTSSLSKLKFLKAKRCVKLKNIFRPSMAEVFVDLQELIINDCSKMEAVVDGEVMDREEEVEDGQRRKTDETLFPYFSKLELRFLPKMMTVCQFTRPLKLPRLSQMVIEDCPRLNSFSSGRVSFPKLLSRDVSYDFAGNDTTVTEEEEPSKMA